MTPPARTRMRALNAAVFSLLLAVALVFAVFATDHARAADRPDVQQTDS